MPTSGEYSQKQLSDLSGSNPSQHDTTAGCLRSRPLRMRQQHEEKKLRMHSFQHSADGGALLLDIFCFSFASRKSDRLIAPGGEYENAKLLSMALRLRSPWRGRRTAGGISSKVDAPMKFCLTAHRLLWKRSSPVTQFLPPLFWSSNPPACNA